MAKAKDTPVIEPPIEDDDQVIDATAPLGDIEEPAIDELMDEEEADIDTLNNNQYFDDISDDSVRLYLREIGKIPPRPSVGSLPAQRDGVRHRPTELPVCALHRGRHADHRAGRQRAALRMVQDRRRRPYRCGHRSHQRPLRGMVQFRGGAGARGSGLPPPHRHGRRGRGVRYADVLPSALRHLCWGRHALRRAGQH